MKIGPFALLPARLAIVEHAPLEDWEEPIKTLFDLQRYVSFYIGDAILFGEARFGDDIWQSVPLDVSERMTMRLAGVASKIPPEDRFPTLSWTHHVTALRIEDVKLRRALLRRAAQEGLGTEDFLDLVKRNAS